MRNNYLFVEYYAPYLYYTPMNNSFAFGSLLKIVLKKRGLSFSVSILP